MIICLHHACCFIIYIIVVKIKGENLQIIGKFSNLAKYDINIASYQSRNRLSFLCTFYGNSLLVRWTDKESIFVGLNIFLSAYPTKPTLFSPLVSPNVWQDQNLFKNSVFMRSCSLYTGYLSLTGEGKLRNRKIISERKQTFYGNSLLVRWTDKESIFVGLNIFLSTNPTKPILCRNSEFCYRTNACVI
jgi:hypothetical protein